MRTSNCTRSRRSKEPASPRRVHRARYHRAVRKSSKQQAEQDKSKLQRVRALPWALLLQMGLVLGRRWRSLSTKDRARLTELTRESRGRLDNLSAKERRELKKLVGKLHPKRTARDLVLLTRARRRRKRR
jgi:hypothetical protein